MGERAVKSYFFPASPQFIPLWEERKNSFTHKAILKKGVWQKEQLTTAHEAVGEAVPNMALVYAHASYLWQPSKT